MPPAIAPLPTIKYVEECGDFSKTVLPFVPQLWDLPQKLLAASSSLDDLKAVYLETNPLITAFAFVLFVSPLFLIASEVNRNYSQVDRFWSILPTVFIGHFVAWAHMSGLPHARLDTIIAFSASWSLRLTFNYWRRGGYKIGSEDYRWEIVQSCVNRSIYFVFNVIFISFLQIVLLFLIATPVYVFLLAATIQGDRISSQDLIFSRLLMGLIVVEMIADQQQWNFHKAKREYQDTAKVPPKYNREDLDRGFCTSGLWAWSRHPNYAAEQIIWFTLYQWSCNETGVYYNWTLAGAMSYLFLFQGSTWLTERISAGKYPDYKIYQRRVSKFLPKLATSSMGAAPTPAKVGNTNATTTTPPAAPASKPRTRASAKPKKR